MTVKRYAERDAMELDKAGDYYCRHVMAMTSEGLHNKGDIAAELGFRDMQIAALQEQVNELAAENDELKKVFEKPQAYLSWHAIPPTWSDPGGGGEYLVVHDSPGHTNDDGSECWPIFPKPELETPATDAAIREIKAQGADIVLRALVTSDDDDFTDAPNICAAVARQLRAGEVE